MGGVFVLFACGSVGVWSAQVHLAHTTGGALLQGFSEAALVSGVLAILVDPYLKRRLQDDSGWTALFGYLNPRASRELREAIQELAACKRYYTKASWHISFAWADEANTILAITLEVVRTGYNIDLEPYRPNGRPWVLASTPGYQTQYLRYSLSCPGHITMVDFRGAALQAFVKTQDDHSLVLDERGLLKGRGIAIPPDARFESINRTRMYRHMSGFVPLHYETFIESLTFALSGQALNDLRVKVQHPRPDNRNLPAEWTRSPTEAQKSAVRTFGRATPGQVTLISWSLAAEYRGD